MRVSDGTNGGTYMMKDIYSGNTTSSISNLIVYSGKLYFSANN
ncbi:TPA: hypothetical protein DIC40_08565 [Patescibacteria group bacterium]|nr:hypothetical protein [Candidatus Gracilibacteria bacterium]